MQWIKHETKTQITGKIKTTQPQNVKIKGKADVFTAKVN